MQVRAFERYIPLNIAESLRQLSLWCSSAARFTRGLFFAKGNKITINITNKSQLVSPFPSDDHKAAMNRRESMTNRDINNTNDPQKKYRLATVSKTFYWSA